MMVVAQVSQRMWPSTLSVKERRASSALCYSPQGMQRGRFMGPYSSAQTSQADSGLRVSMVYARTWWTPCSSSLCAAKDALLVVDGDGEGGRV